MAVVRIDCDRIGDRESFHAVFAEALRACLGKANPRAFDAAWIRISKAGQASLTEGVAKPRSSSVIGRIRSATIRPAPE